jgi:hypothetical protein
MSESEFPRSSLPDEPAPRLTRPSIAGMRRSLLPMWKPRWRPWLPSRVVAVTLTFAGVAWLLVLLTLRVTKHWVLPTAPLAALEATLPEKAAALVHLPPRAAPRADAALAREHRSPLAGGLLTLPPAFRSEDGAYDLVIHFHGNTDLVEESFALSGLNAVVVIMNLGVGSGPYEDRFANALSLPEVLDRTQTTMEKRGLVHPHLRRLALSAWSAGYGAVLKVLEQPALAEKVDAVLLQDGIHVGYQPNSDALILERLAPFERFAREAVLGKRLFSITHSNITPAGHYAGTHETTDALLKAVAVARVPGGDRPELPALHSIEGVIARKRLLTLEPESTARQGGLHVRGYGGDQPDHHIAHLVQMAVTVLPDLVEWWRRDGGSAPKPL